MKAPDSQGNYELVRRLAEGGMGEIFVARKKGTGRFEKDVALKLLLPHLTASEESVRRFYDEASLAARMRHPNIVEIFDVGEAEGRPFIAMQLVDGVSLDRYLRAVLDRGEQVPLPVARAIGLAICEALAYAHGLTDQSGRPLKLVHRDVTPSNVLLSFTGAVQLTDFGIARVGDDKTTNGLRGKAAYVAPEQLTHEAPVDGRADLYASAVTLYELISGQNPFRRKTKEATLLAVLNESLTPLASLRPSVSEQMSAAVMKALARTPAGRFQDATAFRKAFVDGPVASAPELAEHLQSVLGGPAVAVEAEGHETRSQVLRVTRIVSGEHAAEVTDRHERRTVLPFVAGGGAVVALLGLLAFIAWPEPPPEVRREIIASPVAPPRPVELSPVVEGDPGKPPEPVEPKPTTAPEPKPREAAVVKPSSKRLGKAEPKLVESPALQIGYLAADAEPWAEVLVDGARVDRTPFSKYPLPAGKHELTFRSPDGREEKRQVTLSQGKTTSIRVTFASP